jgi:hypothetical protein
MANTEHLALLQQRYTIWNDWRIENPKSLPGLSGAITSWRQLNKVNLIAANRSGQALSGPNGGVLRFFAANALLAFAKCRSLTRA